MRSLVLNYSFVITLLISPLDQAAGQITDEEIDRLTPFLHDSSPTTKFNFVTDDYRINALVRNWTGKWGGPVGTGAIITYSFPDADSNWSDPYEVRSGIYPDSYVRNLGEPDSGLGFITDDEKVHIRLALQAWEDTANITFIEVEESATRVGDIRFARTDNTVSGLPMHASRPAMSGGSADIWIKNNIRSYEPSLSTRFARWDLLHEIGHALGLHHPFGGEHALPGLEDRSTNTVMSYTAQNGDRQINYYIREIPLYDRLAISYLYGPKGGEETSVLGDYTFSGSAKDDVLTGLAGNDEFYGLEGNDTLVSGGGFDRFHGGEGVDTVLIEHPIDSLHISNYPDVYLSLRSCNDNCDSFSLIDVERLQFTDMAIAYDLGKEDVVGQLLRLLKITVGESYITPEVIGLGIDLLENGVSVEDLGNQILTNTLFLEMAGSSSEEAIIDLFFRNVLGRSATDQERRDVLALLISHGGSMSLIDLIDFIMQSDLIESVLAVDELQSTGLRYLP